MQAKPFHPAICAAVLAASSLVAAQPQPVADGPVAQAREQSQAKKTAQPQQVQQAQQAQVAGPGFVFLDEVVSKSPGDKAEYRAIQLDNGMTVLLASDPQANKSLMAAALPVGSMDDPDTQLGLAHYLEHMVLLGSKNYPETGGLIGWLESGTLTDCSVSGSVLGWERTGGASGLWSDGIARRCSVDALVSGTSEVGGFAGRMAKGTADRCESRGSVEGGNAVGGLVGSLGFGKLEKCAVSGGVKGVLVSGREVGKTDR